MSSLAPTCQDCGVPADQPCGDHCPRWGSPAGARGGLEQLRKENERLRLALSRALEGWRYAASMHGSARTFHEDAQEIEALRQVLGGDA